MEQGNIPSLDGEEWRDIPGYEGYYMVSNMGRVKSLKRKVHNTKKSFREINEIVLKFILVGHGYISYQLGLENKRKRYLGHRLVAMAFIDNKDNKPTVNHINGNIQDNRVDNLEWATHSENHNHSYRKLGRKSWWKGRIGSLHCRSKPVIQYNIDGIMINEYESIRQAGISLNISDGLICNCCKGNRNMAGGYIWKYKY